MGFIQGPPTFAVEVRSESDYGPAADAQVGAKRADYFLAGTLVVWDVVDNAVDEYLNRYADAITVALHKSGNAVTVQDNGRGIPVDVHPKHKKTGVDLVFTMLHAGGKFGDNDAYFHSGGLHGVGAS